MAPSWMVKVSRCPLTRSRGSARSPLRTSGPWRPTAGQHSNSVLMMVRCSHCKRNNGAAMQPIVPTRASYTLGFVVSKTHGLNWMPSVTQLASAHHPLQVLLLLPRHAQGHLVLCTLTLVSSMVARQLWCVALYSATNSTMPRWLSWLPWLMLRRTTFMPAARHKHTQQQATMLPCRQETPIGLWITCRCTAVHGMQRGKLLRSSCNP